MKTWIALLALALSTACATSSATRDIDRLVTQTLAEVPDVPSLSIAVVRDGKPVYVRGAGLADVENRIAARAQTQYYIASSTKAFTGLACAILAERGVLDLDAPVTRYLPELTLAPPLDANAITLRRLLTHTSGLSNHAIEFRTAYTGEFTPSLLVSLLGQSTEGKSGFQYSNLGYVVASMVVERVTGKPWQRVVDELVLQPLGMTRTTSTISKAAELALGYTNDRDGSLVRARVMKTDATMHAAGGIVTTASDMARWLIANIRNDGAFAETHRAQAPVSIERGEFKSTGYGFGWYIGQYGGENVLFHLGSFEGWYSHVSFMPEKGMGVVIVTNTSGIGAAVPDFLAARIYDVLLGKPPGENQFASTLKQRKERYLAEVAKRAQRPRSLQHDNAAYAGSYTNPMYGTIVIAQRGDKLVASIGPLTSELEPFTEPESARVEFAGSGEVFRFTFDANGKAESLRWRDSVFER